MDEISSKNWLLKNVHLFKKEKNEIEAEEVVQHRPTTGKVANVIVDTGSNENDDDDADEFLVQEVPKDNLDLDTTENTNVDSNNITLENGDHGALVQQILDTKKELEDGVKPKKAGVEIEHESGVSDFNRQREREATLREIQKLKDSIQVIKNYFVVKPIWLLLEKYLTKFFCFQTLTRSANPLGKLMDFLQEDVDSMQRELETWKTENRTLQAQLR